MFVMMPVQVISRACEKCPWMELATMDNCDAAGNVLAREIRCRKFVTCQKVVEVYQEGENKTKQKRGTFENGDPLAD